MQADVANAWRTVEAKKIFAGQAILEISEWNAIIEAKIEKTDEKIEILKGWLLDQKMKQENYEQEKRMQFEIKLHETKLKLQEELQTKNTTSETTTTQTAQAKLPKLVIIKFNGSYTGWPRFWGVKELINLPYTPPTAKAMKVHEFYEKLSYCVQLLESLTQLHTVDGMAPMTLEKLPAIREDLVRNHSNWETWSLAKLTEALKMWTN